MARQLAITELPKVVRLNPLKELGVILHKREAGSVPEKELRAALQAVLSMERLPVEAVESYMGTLRQCA
jgi:hypothetical protein